MEDPATTVEKFIASSYSEPGMSKVVSVKATPAVAPGENFMSDIWRLQVTIYLDSGEVKKRNFIFKQMPLEVEKKRIVKKVNAFTREILMYQNTFKKMGELMAKLGDGDELPWCDFISHNNYENLLLQDLKPLGYAAADKLAGLTLEEAKVVFRAIGRFHAASKTVMDNGDIQLSDFEPRDSSFCPKTIEQYYIRALRMATKAIDESWGPEWKDVAAKLNQPTEVLVNKMIEAGRAKDSKFNVLIHGDLWTNNVLFKRDETGVPQSVKFVDFQISFCTTFAWDITYLAYTSLPYSLKKEHFNYLLKIYSEALQKDLQRYGYPIERIPTYECILEEMKRTRFWALITIVFYYAIILTGVTGKKEDGLTIINPAVVPTDTPEIYKSQVFKDAVGEDFIDFVNGGLLS